MNSTAEIILWVLLFIIGIILFKWIFWLAMIVMLIAVIGITVYIIKNKSKSPSDNNDDNVVS